MKIPETVKSPIAKVGAGLGAITAIAQPEILFAVADALIASGPQLFSVVSIGALTLPQVFPPETTADWVVVAAGAVFVVYLAREISKNFDKEGL